MSAAIRPLVILGLWLLLASLLGLSTCSPKLDALARVRHAGVLRVATTNTPTTCYDGARGKTGFECDLLAGLARQLGVRLELTFYDSTPAALQAVLEHRADLAAAGVNVTSARAKQFRFGPPFQQAVLELVYRAGSEAPRDLAELSGHLVVVPHRSAEDQLSQVAEGRIDYTVANSDLVALNQRFYPQLRVAFDVSDLQNIAWALPRDGDDMVDGAGQNYVQTLGDVELAKLRDRDFAAAAQADYLGVSRFIADAQQKLPRVRPYFERAAQRYGLDWKLLAAIGYQESRWDAQAVSPTGVRGIMMLGEHRHPPRGRRSQRPSAEHRGRRALLERDPPTIATADRATGPDLDGAGRVQSRHRPPARRARPGGPPRRRSRQLDRRARRPGALVARTLLPTGALWLRARAGGGGLRDQHPQLLRHPEMDDPASRSARANGQSGSARRPVAAQINRRATICPRHRWLSMSSSTSRSSAQRYHTPSG